MNQLDEQEVHVIISRYQEPLTWVKDAFCDVPNCRFFIYNKGVHDIDASILPPNHEIIELPNVGREGHTHLHHICTRYEEYKNNPSCIVACFQGEFYSHLPYIQRRWRGDWSDRSKGPEYDYVMDVITDAKARGLSLCVASHLDMFEGSELYNFKLSSWGPVPMVTVEENFGQWFLKYISKEPEEREFKWITAANFAFDSKCLANKPVAYYKNIMSTIDKDNNPEAGHFCERSWAYIITTPEDKMPLLPVQHV